MPPFPSAPAKSSALMVLPFTVAHTITLALAVLQIVRIAPQLVEIGIAVTIMYVAAENLWSGDHAHRWLLTFGFGLIHGFGFASVLRELGLPSTGLARSLLSFNLGVEAGQLVIVGALWPLLWLLNRQPWSRQVRLGCSIVIFLFGAAWFCERTFGLKLLPASGSVNGIDIFAIGSMWFGSPLPP